MLGIDIFHGLAAGIVRTFRRMDRREVSIQSYPFDEDEFRAEGSLPYASIEFMEGNTYVDPEDGSEQQIQLDWGEFNDEEEEDGRLHLEPLYGSWRPGSSDRVGRKGPQMMADTEEDEKLIIMLYDKSWRHGKRS